MEGTTADKWFALAVGMVAVFVNPAIVGLIWTRGRLDELTGYAPSYVQFFAVALVAAWLSSAAVHARDLTASEVGGLAAGRVLTLLGFYGVLVVMT